MKNKTNIAGAIDRNRIALMRLVFCWLATAYLCGLRGDRPLPRRLSRFVDQLISKAEKAAGYLLIAVFYHGQTKHQRSSAFERAAHLLAGSCGTLMFGRLTIAGIIQRLKALQHILFALHMIARRLAKSIAARAQVLALKHQAHCIARAHSLRPAWLIFAPDDAVPP